MARWLLHACTKLSCWQVTEASEDLGSTQVGLMPGLVWCGSKVAPIQWARHTHLHNLTPRTARPEQSQVDQDNIEHCMAASSIGSCLWQWLRQAKVKREGGGPPYQASAGWSQVDVNSKMHPAGLWRWIGAHSDLCIHRPSPSAWHSIAWPGLAKQSEAKLRLYV